MLSQFVHLQYCYDYLINQIPVGLLLYSHIPTAIIALLFGGFLFFNARNIQSLTLFIVSLFFALWCFVDLSSWFSFLGAGTTMFAWSLADLFSLTFFFFSYYFLYTYITKSDLPLWQKALGAALILPTAAWTFLGSNLTGFDSNTCEAIENEAITGYLFYIEGAFLLAVMALTVFMYRKAADRKTKKEIALAGTGVSIFLALFLAATILASVLVNYDAYAEYAYNFEIYGLFGMPILIIYLGYLIVRYKAFNTKIFAAQALVLALIMLIGSEFAFINSITNRILVAITLVFTGIIGIILIRSVKREIEQREHIEVLAKELQKSNDQQVILIHFITHQIKGFVTKSRNIFSMIMEGDLGPVPEQMKPMVEEGFRSDTKGANTIQEILNAANIKSGKVTYANAPFDLKDLTNEILKDLKPAADTKGLALTLEAPEETYPVSGDRMQMQNALKNLIDNSIKYTPSGSVTISISKLDGKLRFEITDTGVGITPEDMQHLFTEGGHGKESQLINVDSTGFGLYIVKNIIEAHHGKVWAESEGKGKGSHFIVELPA